MNFESTPSEGFVKALAPDGIVEYRPGWLDPASAGRLFDRLFDEIDWQRRTIRMFGRTLEQPRRLRFMGDDGVVYRYSGDEYRAGAWHPAVCELRDRLARDNVAAFNSALVNLYRDSGDSMGWHADDEPELGSNPVIASITLGAARRFELRSRALPRRRFAFTPAAGSLIVMRGDLQHHWQHQLPKTRHAVGPRINLTFRRVFPDRARSRH